MPGPSTKTGSFHGLKTPQDYISLELQTSAHNYHPLPAVNNLCHVFRRLLMLILE